MTFLFYFEQYKESFLSCLVFFLVNGIGTAIIAVFFIELKGLSYLLAGLFASIYAGYFLQKGAEEIDMRIFSKL